MLKTHPVHKLTGSGTLITDAFLSLKFESSYLRSQCARFWPCRQAFDAGVVVQCPSENMISSWLTHTKILSQEFRGLGLPKQSPWVVNTDYQDTRHLDTLHRIYTRISFLALHRSAAWGCDGRFIHTNPVSRCDFNFKTLVRKLFIRPN